MGRARRLWNRCSDTVWTILAFLGVVILLGAVCGMLPWGCAVAPNPDGRGGGVFGIPFGPDGTVDTSPITSSLGAIIGIGAAAIGVPGVGVFVSKFFKAATERANLQGQAIGWVDREQAGTIQAPLPGPVAYGAGVPRIAGGIAPRSEVTG